MCYRLGTTGSSCQIHIRTRYSKTVSSIDRTVTPAWPGT